MYKTFCDKCKKEIAKGYNWGEHDKIEITLKKIEGNIKEETFTEIRADGWWDLCRDCFNQLDKPIRGLVENLGLKLRDSDHPEGCECNECGE